MAMHPRQTSPNPPRFGFTESDRQIFEQALNDFVVPGAFDAHGHLYDPSLAQAGYQFVPQPYSAMTWRLYQEIVAGWMGARAPTGGLFFPFPAAAGDAQAQNAWLLKQLIGRPQLRGLVLATPSLRPQDMEPLLDSEGVVGFKVYHCYADVPDTFQAGCEQFIPEWTWELAEARGLVIMLHLVKARGLSDPANQQYIQERCRRYPHARLVLAHCARGFQARHTVNGIAGLRGLDNVYFDNSAVCEAAAHEAILRVFGPTRLWFGLDHPVSSIRGRCVNLGDGFLWTNELPVQWSGFKHGQPTLVGIENLLALRQACQNCNLNDRDVELIFGGAARQVLDVPADGRGDSQVVDVQTQYVRAKRLIPGGTQLLSKRPEMFAPGVWPAYYEEARGCEIVDTQGRKWLDMSSGGILACILGYADPDVNAAVVRRVQMGSMSTLQTFDEVQLAELLVELHPWAEQVRYTRGGGEAMAVAVRLARAATGRDHVAVCGYHGWHDWYLAANLATDAATDVSAPERSGAGSTVDASAPCFRERLAGHLLPGLHPRGVPLGLAGTTLPFRYNQLDELDRILERHGKRLAAVVMEPTRHTDPAPGFLEGVRQRCDDVGARLVFDEISIGWRLCLGGAHRLFGVTPDLAVFAKTISNGFAMGAVIGRRTSMEAAQDSFISSAYWTEGVGPAAALATVRKLMRLDVPSHLAEIGSRLGAGWLKAGQSAGLPVTRTGRDQLVALGFDHPQSAALTTLLTVRMLDHGILAGGYFNPMWTHTHDHVQRYLGALRPIFAELRQALDAGDLESRLPHGVRHTGFTRLT